MTIGVSVDAGSVGKDIIRLVSTVITDGRTRGGKDGAVTESVSDDAEGITEDDPTGVGEDVVVSTVVTDDVTVGDKEEVVQGVSDNAGDVTEDSTSGVSKNGGRLVSTVVTDGVTAGGNDGAAAVDVSGDARGVPGDVPTGTGDDAEISVPPAEGPPAST